MTWVQDANPDHLPASQDTDPSLPTYFKATEAFTTSAQQQGGQQAHGINNNTSNPYVAGDTLDLTFHYAAGQDFNSVLDALNDTNRSTRLAIGFHVTGYTSGSDSVIGTGVTAVPLPRAAWAGLGLMGSIAAYRLRRRASAVM